jgi:hypothetical protein
MPQNGLNYLVRHSKGGEDLSPVPGFAGSPSLGRMTDSERCCDARKDRSGPPSHSHDCTGSECPRNSLGVCEEAR